MIKNELAELQCKGNFITKIYPKRNFPLGFFHAQIIAAVP